MSGPVDDVGLRARLEPDRLAAVELATGRRWTYAELHDAIGRCAAVLRSLGLGEGDRLASHARNRLLLIILHFACAREGIIYVPLNWRLTDTELAAQIADCAPALLIHDDGNARGVEGLSVQELGERVERTVPQAAQPFDRERPSLILYSSGTSGQPKGAVHNERSLSEAAINFALLGRVDGGSRVLNDSPMFHVIGLVTNVRPALMQGGAILISEGFDPDRTLARIADPALAVSHYFGVPQMARMLRLSPAYDPAKLRRLAGLFTGGAPFPPADLLQWLDEGIPLVNGYGMSECGTITGMPIDLATIRQHPSSAGVATPRIELRCVDPHECQVAAGAAGEIQVRGRNLLSGYWRRPAETELAMAGDGWFRTGDIGVLDADGFVTILDRKKDMFISGGENVFPAEIEAVAAACPGVAEAAVIGVPDPRWGEVGHLFVTLHPSCALAPNQLSEFLSARLAPFKQPKQIRVMEALPRNGAGKVLKAALREPWPEATLPERRS